MIRISFDFISIAKSRKPGPCRHLRLDAQYPLVVFTTAVEFHGSDR